MIVFLQLTSPFLPCHFTRRDPHLLFEDTGEVLRGPETAGKADLLDGHLRVPQQLDRFVDPDLVQVVQRGEVQVLGEQFAQIPFSDSSLRRDIADRDIGSVVQTDIGDRLFQRIVCTNRKIVHDNQILVVFALLVHLIDNALHGTHDTDVVHNLDQPVFFGKDRDRCQFFCQSMIILIKAGKHFKVVSSEPASKVCSTLEQTTIISFSLKLMLSFSRCRMQLPFFT